MTQAHSLTLPKPNKSPIVFYILAVPVNLKNQSPENSDLGTAKTLLHQPIFTFFWGGAASGSHFAKKLSDSLIRALVFCFNPIVEGYH
jgi:hypothetical protein